VTDTIDTNNDAAARRGGDEPAAERPTRGTTVGALSDAELRQMIDAVTKRDKDFFQLRRRRNFRVRKMSVFEREHFARHSSLNYDELPPGYSWHIVVFNIRPGVRQRVPFIAQHRKVVEATEAEARAIYALVCGERWKELAEQAKERGTT